MHYALLTGRAPMPPQWALGYPPMQVELLPRMQLAANFRERRIPCDGIWLDIVDYMHEYRCFTWDSERFPDPPALATYLHDHGFRLVVIVDPGIKRDESYFAYRQLVEGGHGCKTPDGDTYIRLCMAWQVRIPGFYLARSPPVVGRACARYDAA